jgi:hypothetical protein
MSANFFDFPVGAVFDNSDSDVEHSDVELVEDTELDAEMQRYFQLSFNNEH